MALVNKPNIFQVGQVADSAAVNANFDTIYNDYNGNVTDANIANTGITTYGKVSGSSLATLGNINSGAGTIPAANIPTLADSKLSTITTAGKVDGSAITNLANIPSGAGQVPAANLNNVVGLGSWNTGTSGTATTDIEVMAYADIGSSLTIVGTVASTIRQKGGPASDQAFSIQLSVAKGEAWSVTGSSACYWRSRGV